MKIGTLRKFLCTLSIGAALLLGMSIPTEAQNRRSSYSRWRARNYGQQVSASRHRRNSQRRRLRRHQVSERHTLNARLRSQREQYGNSRDWRYSRRQQRTALRQHQRGEKKAFKQRWKNNRRGRN
jgi:hypothetical protein